MSTPVLLVIIFVAVSGAGYWLRHINIRHLEAYGTEVPTCFLGAVDGEVLAKTAAYTVEQSRLGLWESLVDNLLLLAFLFGGVLPVYDRWVSSVALGFTERGILFFLLLSVATTVLEIPFSLYGTFRIENHYGFNTMTFRLWVSDLVKSILIGTVLLGLVCWGAFALVAWSPDHWWIWVWGFFACVSIFLMYLSPVVIEPLFNKFEPVADKELEREIVHLMQRAGLRVKNVMQVDASRRSRHSNAYFTGIGRVKRIVLYDTLLEQMTHGEILAVLAHEVGHWKKGHVAKRLVTVEVGALLVCYAAFVAMSGGWLPGLFGLGELSFPGQLVLLGFLGPLGGFFLTPAGAWLSRRHEREADRYAVTLSGRGEELASALVKLARENLSNLHPHPLYAAFYYSHPPVVERVAHLRGLAAQREEG